MIKSFKKSSSFSSISYLSICLLLTIIMVPTNNQIITSQQMFTASSENPTYAATLSSAISTITPLEMESILTVIGSFFFSPAPLFPTEARKFLRMAFHDCMGGYERSINFGNADNAGLTGPANNIAAAYAQATDSQKSGAATATLFMKLSRADFFVLVETRALGWGMKNGNSLPSFTNKPVFLYGRTSASNHNSDTYEGPSGFPDGINNWDTVISKTIKGVPTITQTDIVALFGLHGSGTTSLAQSGFSGPWGPQGDLNTVNNHFYINLLGYGYPANKFTQVKATESGFGQVPPNFSGNKIEWVHTSGASNAKMMMPADMMIYLNFTANSTGGTSQGEYCSQGSASTITDCSKANSKYLKPSKNAPQALRYAKSNAAYVDQLIPSFLKLVSYNNPSATLKNFSPTWQCVNKVAKCLGNVLFTGCGTNTSKC